MRKDIKTVNVLGTVYTIHLVSPENTELDEAEGMTYPFRKAIFITNDCPKEFQKHIIRHEIIHAFLFECGLNNQWEHIPRGHDEEVVDWIALKFDKIKVAFEEAGVL